MNILKHLYIVGFLAFITLGCEKEYSSIEELDEKNITDYLQKNNLSMKRDSGGIYYQIVVEGKGAPIDYKERTLMHFSQRSLDGSYENSDTIINRYNDFFGYLSPTGIRETVKNYLKNKGGKIRIIIPSRQAFGRNGTGKIPANASLDYVVTVLDDKKLANYDDYSIKNYLERNNLTGFASTPSGLYYKITAAPISGSPITVDSLVSVEYTGKLLNGTIFESGKSDTLSSVGSFIKAWVEALPMIRESGQIRIIAPSHLAYGKEGRKDPFGKYIIPPLSALDFDIKVTKVQEPEEEE